jgi:hypothetical protein
MVPAPTTLDPLAARVLALHMWTLLSSAATSAVYDCYKLAAHPH